MTSFGVDDFLRQQVRTFTASNQQTDIVILRGSLGSFDRATGKVAGLTGAATIFAGKARIYPIRGGRIIQLGGGEQATADTMISIPIDAPLPHRDDIVVVGVDDPADATDDNMVLRVLGANAGGLFGDARRIQCGAWNPSRGRPT